MTVLIAFAANVLVALAKTVAAMLTSSASMVAEAAHSWSDAANEIFLLIADKRSAKAKDARHPLGYGREAYVWSMFAAVGIFTAGAVVSIMHGAAELSNPEPVEDPLLAYLVLAVSFVLEAISFTQAFRQSLKAARRLGQSTLRYVFNSSDATLRAVFAEDSAALIGLVIAGAGIAVHEVTGDAIFDALGSIAIGVLLAVVAIVLIERNRYFLVGAASSLELRRKVGMTLLARPEIERVTYLHLEYVGPNRLFLVAEVDLAGNAPEEEVAVTLRKIERGLEGHQEIEEAVLSLSVSDEPPLDFAKPRPVRQR